MPPKPLTGQGPPVGRADMGWENGLLGILSIGTLLMAFARFGWSSFVSLGILGALLYAMPAVIGLYSPIYINHGPGRIFVQPSPDAVLTLTLAWLVFAPLVAVLPVAGKPVPLAGGQVGGLLRATLLLTIAGYLVIAATLGPTYFLQDRSETTLGLFSTLWRWTFVFGLVLSVQERRHWFTAVFALFLVMHMVAGDRTIPAITFGAVIIGAFLSGDRRAFLPPLRVLVMGMMVFALLVIAKPLYVFLKSPNLELAGILLHRDQLLLAAQSFEPLGTFSLLNFVVVEGVSMPRDVFLVSVLGNALIMPSLFGVDTNFFNSFVTSQLPGHLGFGVAGNFFAHGYVVFGPAGVIAFAALFVMALYGLEVWAMKSHGVWRVAFIISGATIGLYAHRNGLDNLLSFIRQIFIVALMLAGTTFLERHFLPRTHERGYSVS